jgi:hypothetical protein
VEFAVEPETPFALPPLPSGSGETRHLGDKPQQSSVKAVKIACGDGFVVALDDEGKVWTCWVGSSASEVGHRPGEGTTQVWELHADFKHPLEAQSHHHRITHVSAHFETFFAYAPGSAADGFASSVVLKGSKNDLHRRENEGGRGATPEIVQELQGKGVIKIVVGACASGFLSSQGRALTVQSPCIRRLSLWSPDFGRPTAHLGLLLVGRARSRSNHAGLAANRGCLRLRRPCRPVCICRRRLRLAHRCARARLVQERRRDDAGAGGGPAGRQTRPDTAAPDATHSPRHVAFRSTRPAAVEPAHPWPGWRHLSGPHSRPPDALLRRHACGRAKRPGARPHSRCLPKGQRRATQAAGRAETGDFACPAVAGLQPPRLGGGPVGAGQPARRCRAACARRLAGSSHRRAGREERGRPGDRVEWSSLVPSVRFMCQC